MAELSNLERYRTEREDQDSERRAAIVDAAEALFLERGIVETTMMNIADRAKVSRVTVYRYFSQRDHVAYEVAGRMLGKLAVVARDAASPGSTGVDATRAGLLALIARFDEFQDAHRFLAMFDSMRPAPKPSDDWARWYRGRAASASMFDDSALFPEPFDSATAKRLVTLGNAVLGALGRFATQGEMLTRGSSVELGIHLENLKDLTLDYFADSVIPQQKS